MRLAETEWFLAINRIIEAMEEPILIGHRLHRVGVVRHCICGHNNQLSDGLLLNNLSDIIITTENCCTTFMGVLNFVRLIHLRLNQRKFRQLIENFSYEIWIPK